MVSLEFISHVVVIELLAWAKTAYEQGRYFEAMETYKRLYAILTETSPQSELLEKGIDIDTME